MSEPKKGKEIIIARPTVVRSFGPHVEAIYRVEFLLPGVINPSLFALAALLESSTVSLRRILCRSLALRRQISNGRRCNALQMQQSGEKILSFALDVPHRELI